MVHCSQTIYETVLGCCRFWRATGDSIWRDRASSACELLLGIQQPDGGFDIGYDFDFGMLHRKGQSTSPEMVGLVALCEYAQLFGAAPVADAARRAAEWIGQHAVDVGHDRIAVPYSPLTTNRIMVYNGTSFACGALGCYLGTFTRDTELESLYRGMLTYLDRAMSVADGQPGRFWYYSDQSRDDLDDLKRIKIDYYHQMQQVEVHSLAQRVAPESIQAEIVHAAADHVAELAQRHDVVPYTNDARFFRGQIHLWGLSSVAAGMLEASGIDESCRNSYHTVARRTLDWIIDHGWRGGRFSAVLSPTGERIGVDRYMVRSDAWIFNALGAATLHLGPGRWTEVADRCYRTMAAANFSGPESHASNRRTRLLKRSWMAVKKLSTG